MKTAEPTQTTPTPVNNDVAALTPDQRAAAEAVMKRNEDANAKKNAPTGDKPNEGNVITKENEAAVASVLGEFMVKKQAKKKTPEEEEAEADAAEKKKEEAEAKKKAEAKKRRETKPAAPAQTVDAEKIAEAAGRGVAEALAKRDKKTDKVDDKTDDNPDAKYTWLTDKDKRKLPILRQMEKANPTAYKGLTDKYANSVKAIAEYQAQWAKDNKDKEWNAEDEEHNEFFAKHDVDWDQDDYQEAIADLKVESRLAEERKVRDKEMGELKQRETLREVEPRALAESAKLSRQFFTELGGDFVGVRLENGAIDPQAVKKLNGDDPGKAQIVFERVTQLENETAEIVRLFGGAVRQNLDIPLHKRLVEYATAKEKELLALPDEQKKDANGRDFLPSAEFYALPKEKQGQHWTFTAVDINALLTADAILDTKRAIANHEAYIAKIMKAKGYVKPDTEDGERITITNVDKPVSPEGGDGQKPVPDGKGGRVVPQNDRSKFFQSFIHG